MKIYTGIGSRQTPEEVLKVIREMSKLLSNKGYLLRSGAADGADRAFESYTRNKEIWVPWLGFNGSKSQHLPSPQAFELVATIHPKWNTLNDAAKRLHARNAHQVLGANLASPSKFVICWTPLGETVGGTATAIKLALNRSIPVLNLGKYNPASMHEVLEDFLILNGEYNDI